MKKILIDLQCLQTDSAYRGIGRYAYNLTINILKQNTEYDINILLSSALPNAAIVRKKFSDFLPDSSFHVFTPVTPCFANDPNNWNRMEVSEFMYEAFVANINPDLLFITSLFEGFTDSAIISSGRYFYIPTVVIGYDLIPLNFSETYFQNYLYKKYYLHKLLCLYISDNIWSISDYTNTEISSKLDLDNCYSIGTGCDSFFMQNNENEDLSSNKINKIIADNKFILYAGGFDWRKNVSSLLYSYKNLPKSIKNEYLLVIAGHISEGELQALKRISNDLGIVDNIIFTGSVSDGELVRLYKSCSLFIFPSLEEGFGLTVLEAMVCGAIVCCSNNSALIEVSGLEEMLFIPTEDYSNKINQLLTDLVIRKKIEHHSKNHILQFNWKDVSIKSLDLMKNFFLLNKNKISLKKRLAFLSPLPPEKSGISDYSNELLPHLSKYYNISLITDLTVTNDFIDSNYCKINYTDFINKDNEFSRVLYQFGNSPFHTNMYKILPFKSGVSVLHDFYLSAMINYETTIGRNLPGNFLDYILDDHGLNNALIKNSYNDFVDIFPVNKKVINYSKGVIFHSNYNIKMFHEWYPNDFLKNISVINQLRSGHKVKGDESFSFQILSKFSVKLTDRIIVSLGGVDQKKNHHLILETFGLYKDFIPRDIKICLVGEHDNGEYYRFLKEIITRYELDNVVLTNRVSAEEYQAFIRVACMAIQLRTNTRGETSRAILDCFANNVPVVANNHGTVRDLPLLVLELLPDKFQLQELFESIISILENDNYRNKLISNASNYLKTLVPSHIANDYYKAIENFYEQMPNKMETLVGIMDNINVNTVNILCLMSSIQSNLKYSNKCKKIYYDVTNLVSNNLKTGIERVTTVILINLLNDNNNQIVPVRFEGDKCFTAHGLILKTFNKEFDNLVVQSENVIENFDCNSIFICTEFHNVFSSNNIITSWLSYQRNNRLVSLVAVVYDLIPLQYGEYCVSWLPSLFEQYLLSVREIFDIAIAISLSTANQYIEYVGKANSNNSQYVGYFHLGCDIDNYNSHHSSDNVEDLSMLNDKKYMLMVSTIEPRKGHVQVLEAFEKLWDNGSDYCLVFVGKQGWNVDELIAKINCHTQLNKKLFWLQGISDQALTKVYEMSSAFIMASFAEGFGLGIVESAKYHKPLILRDIPVFREIAEEHAYYFDCLTGEELAISLEGWITLYEANSAPSSKNLKTITWEESCKQLMDVILHDKWYKVLNNA